MMDLVFLLVLAGFSGLSWAFVVLCNLLLGNGR